MLRGGLNPLAMGLFRGDDGLDFDRKKAIRALKAADPKLARVIERVGALKLEAGGLQSPFHALAESIAYQQLTGKAAATIFGRVCDLFPRKRPTPERLVRVPDAALRACGLSRAKTLAVKDLAAKTLDGTVPTMRALLKMSDEEIVERLTAVRGIGRWTVEMLLIFRLGRGDVLPTTDYGIRKGFKLAYSMRELPTPRQIAERGERWRPYRSAASWYLWRVLDSPAGRA